MSDRGDREYAAGDEIARLHAEVERLTNQLKKYDEWDKTPDDCYELTHAHLKRERDEAPARLANCGQENCMGWKLKDHTNWVTEDRYQEALAQVAVLLEERSSNHGVLGTRPGHVVPSAIADGARALLTRLEALAAQVVSQSQDILVYETDVRQMKRRLQRAEAVVEAAKTLWDLNLMTRALLGDNPTALEWQRGTKPFIEALAAWEEGTALRGKEAG